MLSRPEGVGYDSTGDGGSDSPLRLVPSLSDSAASLLQQQQPEAHEKKLATFSLSWLMLTDIVGTSVLTLAEVGSKLGWAWLVVIIACMCPVAIYSAGMMVRTRTEMVLAGMEPPRSMGHAASLLCPGSRCVSVAVYCMVYGYAILGNSSYLLVIGNSLQGALFISFPEFCLPAAVAASCLLLLPLVVGMRWLTQSVWMCLLNMLLLLVALATVIGDLAASGRAPGVQTFASAPTLTVFTLFGATSNIVYAYTGHWMYFELMDEMRAPQEFARTFLLTAPFMVVTCVQRTQPSLVLFQHRCTRNDDFLPPTCGSSAIRSRVSVTPRHSALDW